MEIIAKCHMCWLSSTASALVSVLWRGSFQLAWWIFTKLLCHTAISRSLWKRSRSDPYTARGTTLVSKIQSWMLLEGQARPEIFAFLIADLINKCTYYPLGMQFPNHEVLMWAPCRRTRACRTRALQCLPSPLKALKQIGEQNTCSLDKAALPHGLVIYFPTVTPVIISSFLSDLFTGSLKIWEAPVSPRLPVRWSNSCRAVATAVMLLQPRARQDLC